MATARNCNLPDDLYYVIEKHVWARLEGDVVTVGITDVAQNLAKTLIAVTPKKVGRTVRKGQNVGTVESGKFVGPVPAPVSGEIIEVNQAVMDRPAGVNEDPYGGGWIAKLRPSDWDAESADLATGADGIAAYEQFLEREGISCEG
jgi:glycine cleavage system H protein